MTPEALAEINGHTDVIRVLRVWEHLQIQDGIIQEAPPSPASSSIDRYGSMGSRKGKERSLSFVSNVSTGSQGFKVRKSIEGFLRSRSGSVAAADVPPVPQIITSEDDGHDLSSPVDLASPISPSATSRTSGAALGRATSGASAASGGALARVASTSSSQHVDDDPPTPLTPITPVSPNHTYEPPSRRPSLPSIFEKAAHPGQAFRAALRKDKPDHSSHGLFRGRLRSNESANSNSSPRKHHTKHALASLFRRGSSPPSRSPSPPRKKEATKPPEPEEIDEGIERLKRASLDLGMRESGGSSMSDTGTSAPEVEDVVQVRQPPASAPAIKTTFFDTDPTRIPLPSSPAPSIHNFSRPVTRPRQGSEVIAPSPLSNEWANNSSDSDSPSTRGGIRRSKTEIIKSGAGVRYGSFSSLGYGNSLRTRPTSPLVQNTGEMYKNRSVTMPIPPLRTLSQTRNITGLPPLRITTSSPSSPPRSPQTSPNRTSRSWAEAMRLRKFTSSSRRTPPKEPTFMVLPPTQVDNSTDDDTEQEEEYHDAEDLDELPQIEALTMDTPVMETTIAAETPGPVPVDSEVIAVQEGTEAKESPELDKTSLDTERGDNNREEKDVELPAAPETPVETPAASNPPTPPRVTTGKGSIFVEMIESPNTTSQGRYRGASVGSVSATTESSRISTPPGSSLRMSLINSDEDHPAYGPKAMAERKKLAQYAQMGKAVEGRDRGKSISSTSSSASGMAFSYGGQPSSPSASLTPPSTLSLHVGGFPPVPEHPENEPTSIIPHPTPRRKVSSRAEARHLVKQAEKDILKMASQLPDSADSSRDLAAQLAAYGDNHAIEAEFAERDRERERRVRRPSGSELSSDDWFSAQSDGSSAMDGGPQRLGMSAVDTGSMLDGRGKGKSSKKGESRRPSPELGMKLTSLRSICLWT